MEYSNICAKMPEDSARFYNTPSVPIFHTSLFVKNWDEENQKYHYTRDTNPTITEAEVMLAALEGSEGARIFASGMAAISSSIFACVKSGGHVVAMRNIYGGSIGLFENVLAGLGISVTYVDGVELSSFEAAIQPNTTCFYIESPSWIYYEIVDITKICELAHSRGAKVIIDNTWSTPLYQNPGEFGVDLVMYSASKYLGGHSDIVAGAVTGKEEILAEVHKYRSHLGGNIGPEVAWLLARSMRSLPYRMRAHSENVELVLAALQKNPKVKRIFHPSLPTHLNYELGKKQMRGYSAVLGFTVECEEEEVNKMLRTAKLIHTAPSWGGFETLLVNLNAPKIEGTTEKEKYFRLSVGLEDMKEIISDINNMLSVLG